MSAVLACLDAQGEEREQSVAANREARLSIRVRTPADPVPRALRSDEVVHLVQ
jgi:hypothetical protein